MKKNENRNLKVYELCGYNNKPMPQIRIQGKWLQKCGFSIGDYVSVQCKRGKLIITLDAKE